MLADFNAETSESHIFSDSTEKVIKTFKVWTHGTSGLLARQVAILQLFAVSLTPVASLAVSWSCACKCTEQSMNRSCD